MFLRLPRALYDIVGPSGQVVLVPGPSPHSRTVTETYFIDVDDFEKLIQRDGFGDIFWNDLGEQGFVSMVVEDDGLVADFIRVGKLPNTEENKQ